MQSPKRIKLTHATDVDTTDVKHIQDLPPEIFQHCLDFVGKGNFAFVAPVSKRFYWGYINLDVDRTVFDVDTVLEQGRNKRTTAEVVSNGSLRLATECFLKAPKEFKEEVCRRAAVKGRVDILDCAVALGVEVKSIFEMGIWEKREAVIQTLENGHFDVIEFLSKEGVNFKESHFYYGLLNKALVIGFHWMTTNGIMKVKREEMASKLARNGELHILKEHYADCITQTTFLDCALGGHLEIMNWMLQIKDCEWDQCLFRCAARGGSIPILELCIQNGCTYNDFVCLCAVQDDKTKTINTLKWLHAQNFPLVDSYLVENICNHLADYCNVEGLKLTREIGFNWDISTFERAAGSGDIATLEYCLKNGCPYGPSLYEKAFGKNTKDEQTLNVYKWLHQHGIPWDERACNAAVYSGHMSTLKWALENGCPCSDEILRESIRNVNMSMLEIYLNNVEHIERDVYIHVMEDAADANAIILQIGEVRIMMGYFHVHRDDG